MATRTVARPAPRSPARSTRRAQPALAPAGPGADSAAAPATIRDVARQAGVSVATVSRVVNAASNVTPETRERVNAAAAALRFTPSSAARSLITRRTQTIGALLPDLYGEYFSELIRGIDLKARARGLHLLVSSSHGDVHEAAAALRAMHGRVDGLLVMSPHLDSASLGANLPQGVPVVLINTRLADAGYSSFAVDNHAGAFAMTRHLVQRGHHRIAFIGGPANNYEAQERLRGYRSALAELRPGTPELVFDGDFTEESGWRAGSEIAMLAERPDAVFCGNDMMAIGCLAAFAEAGVRVPQDIALAGFDDIPIARYVTPPLTTVRVRIADLGGLALERLAGAIDNPGRSTAQHQTLRAELVVRQSCGPG
ncbi:LacI family DNA-binding transcriptional regulator [Aquabacterium humicola]|uniref:LacI family DNA-binding transcriptional regulator n=1 Tax=Aquabacterium humicola TaxID=3237377 RepID=UPI0025432A9C|nr:LacI family DNA-binding transcriptional regulator [Rubrivivax pictus]